MNYIDGFFVQILFNFGFINLIYIYNLFPYNIFSYRKKQPASIRINIYEYRNIHFRL
jgi:hypothetical protein